LREFDDNRRISVTEDTLHCEEPPIHVHEADLAEQVEAELPEVCLMPMIMPPSIGPNGEQAP